MFSSVNTCWTLVGAFLVYFMQAGFALCEAGFTRAKNTGNILMKNMMDFCIGTPCYWLIGFGLMFGGTGALIGGFDPFIQGDYSHLGLDIPLWVYIVFQTVFCATAATIVSGSMAERTNFKAYCVYSAAISLVVGVLLGILQTAFKDKVFDWIGTAYTVFVNAVPSLVSYSLVLVFGSKYLGFPTLYSTRNVGPSSVLPIVCLSLASIAGYALWTRRYMVDELTRDYIKLARVKGLSSSEIMFKHVLRNAMVPMVQYIPQSILLTVGGSLLMERFFSVPGMGPLLTDAIQRYDLNVVQTLVILYAVLGIVGVFMGDVLMMLVDPRITLTGKEAAR